MSAEVYLLRRAGKPAGEREAALALPANSIVIRILPLGERIGGPMGIPASERPSAGSAVASYEKVLVGLWPPSLPGDVAAFALLPGALVWRRDDEGAAAFAQRAAEVAKLCGLRGEVVTIYRRAM